MKGNFNRIVLGFVGDTMICNICFPRIAVGTNYHFEKIMNVRIYLKNKTRRNAETEKVQHKLYIHNM